MVENLTRPRLTLFTGLGGRLLDDRSGSKASQGGYDREIYYSYVPVGVAAAIPLDKAGPSLLLSAQFNWLAGGDAKSKFARLDPEVPNVKVGLRSGWGLEAAAAVRVPIGPRAIIAGPFVRHWNVGRSKILVLTDPDFPDAEIQFFEPRNRTTELGFRITLAF